MSLRMAGSSSVVRTVAPSKVLSFVSRTPFAPNSKVPARSVTPGGRVIIGDPLIVPCTSMTSAPELIAPASSAGAVTTVALTATPSSISMLGPSPFGYCRYRVAGCRDSLARDDDPALPPRSSLPSWGNQGDRREAGRSAHDAAACRWPSRP